jgi:hypothetical protein
MNVLNLKFANIDWRKESNEVGGSKELRNSRDRPYVF